ncbi:hypothetical protein [Bradyrhizobium sp. CB2312]|uniref:hypothetical protein n=1 Tax=Bradyrhizobium sp. CB2312 TaxID=3039155 RepID=UPI0024B15B93|nr:hypothetical protein [Bradyrhizobium sp. CB2312]WFU76747.1 hypothetical protein QA642_23475 [Bradyrhizobium sp. CB2312]
MTASAATATAAGRAGRGAPCCYERITAGTAGVTTAAKTGRTNCSGRGERTAVIAAVATGTTPADTDAGPTTGAASPAAGTATATARAAILRIATISAAVAAGGAVGAAGTAKGYGGIDVPRGTAVTAAAGKRRGGERLQRRQDKSARQSRSSEKQSI